MFSVPVSFNDINTTAKDYFVFRLLLIGFRVSSLVSFTDVCGHQGNMLPVPGLRVGAHTSLRVRNV